MIIKPYIAKQFKILESVVDQSEDAPLDVDYVEPFSDADMKEIEFLLEKPIKLYKQIPLDEYKTRYNQIYVSPKDETVKVETKKLSSTEAVKKEQVQTNDMIERKNQIKERLAKIKETTPQTPTDPKDRKIDQLKYADSKSNVQPPVMTMNDMLKEVPLNLLISEIRRRQLAEKMTGQLIVDNNQKVSFQLTELKWPTGVYEIDITLTKDITDDYINAQKKKQEKEKQQLLTETGNK